MLNLNLLIVHSPGHQALSEWEEVARRINGIAPGIDVRIVKNGEVSAADVQKWQESRPSLVFSVRPIMGRQPRRGKVYANALLSKLEEFRRMSRASLPVPEAAELSPATVPESTWGEFVITKPLYGSQGEHVRLVRSAALAGRYQDLLRRAGRPLLVQRFVEHVDEKGRPCAYRVYLLFGRELYASFRRWQEPRRPLAQIANNPDGVIADNAAGIRNVRELSFDQDVIQLARHTHTAFPEIPALGVDVIRETGTGKLFVLEVNSGGPGWYFHAPIAQGVLDPEFVRSIRGQFDYLNRTAELLVEKTRSEAVL